MLALSLGSLPAAAQLCINDSTYFDLSDDDTSYPFCHDGILTCETPVLGAPIYTVEAGCNPLIGPCAVTAEVDVTFPGNHQNDPLIVGLGYSFGTLLLTDAGGGVIDACGVAGATIRRDFGRFEHSESVSCAQALTDPTSLQLKLEATMCPCAPNLPICPWQACEKKAMVTLDFGAPVEALCEVPPPSSCGGDGQCMACFAGGGGPGGGGGGPGGGGPPGAPGKGGGCADGAGVSAGGGGASTCPGNGGAGATLRYRAGGVGHPSFPGSSDWNVSLGRYWSHDAAERIVEDPGPSHVWLLTRYGTFREFFDADGDGDYERVVPSDEYRRLARVGGGWQLTFLDGTLQEFDAAGLWRRAVNRYGRATEASYAGSQLTSVSFPDGRSERFTYHPDGKLATMTEVGVDGVTQRTWSYTWSGFDLARIDLPDSTAWAFVYDDPRYPGYMTRKVRVATDGSQRIDRAWEYDDFGNAIRTWRGATDAESPEAEERWAVVFDRPFLPRVATITDALGNVSVYTVERDPTGIKTRITRISGDCGSCGLGPQSQLFYEDPANPLRVTRWIDGGGTTALFSYDANGRLRTRVEALGTADERTTTWEYDPTYPALVTEVAEPSTSGSGFRRMARVRDAAGNVTQEIHSGIENGSAFSDTTARTYNGAGQTTLLDPPGHGADNQVGFTYDAARGDVVLTGRDDPLVAGETYRYDPFNRRNGWTDDNGVVTDLLFDAMGRARFRTLRGAVPAEDVTTEVRYTPFGQPFQVILPEGNVIEYGYDSLGRVVSVEKKPSVAAGDHGERVLFTLNRLGLRIRSEHQEWTGSAWSTVTWAGFVYSSRCHVDKIEHADGRVTELSYDCDGRLADTWDANHPRATSPPTRRRTYDALGRLVTLERPWGGAGGGSETVRFRYDVQDHLIEMTDGNGTVTGYTFSDRDRMTRFESESAGATTFAYDEVGRLFQRTDARGQVTQMLYDELDRPVEERYPGAPAFDVQIGYDDPAVPFSAGRRTSIERNGHRLEFAYDRFGRTTRDGDLLFAYDKNGRRTRVIYPSGLIADYAFDFADREASLSLDLGGSSQSVVSAASYAPVGPLTRLELGNGMVETRRFDARMFPERIEAGSLLRWQYSTDGVGNILAITDELDPPGGRVFGYQDYQYYLTSADGPWGSLAWTWDRIGNRLTETRDGVNTAYGYLQNAAGNDSPVLATATRGAAVTTFHHDPSGQLTSLKAEDRGVAYRYDATRRLAEVRTDAAELSASRTELEYDARGLLRQARRATVAPEVESEWIAEAVYDSAGRVFERTVSRFPTSKTPRGTPPSAATSRVVYFDGRPVALVDSAVRFVTTDHLGRPILVTDTAGNEIWSGGLEPFGVDFAGAVAAGVFVGLPGQAQMLDAGEGLRDNVRRTYRPDLGRYLTPDPAGIKGGGNPYLYAEGNPLRFIDPTGLAAWDVTGTWTTEQQDDYADWMRDFIADYAEEIDCADLALAGLAQFASENGLPVRLRYWDGTQWQYYDASSDDFTSAEQFENVIRQNLGALNVIDNTRRIQPSDLQGGDFLMSRWRNGRGHTRIVDESTCDNETCSDPTVTWYQGNLPPVIPQEVTGPLSGIDGGTLDDEDIPRRWNFDRFSP